MIWILVNPISAFRVMMRKAWVYSLNVRQGLNAETISAKRRQFWTFA